MGGSVGNTLGNIAKNPVRLGADVMTFGTAELANKGLGGGLFGGGSNPSAVMAGGTQSPMDMLTSSGGAPLLTSIALGVKPDDALASFFGVSPQDWPAYKNSLSTSEQSSLDGLSGSLNEISSNTDMRNQAVQKLVTDFPNFMADNIQKYKGIADQATLGAAKQALDQTAAKYAAGGGLSSGASAAALARTAAGTASANLNYGTSLAGQDWQNQFSAASALQNFQQKMLGQGSTQGFNAVQNALSGNRQVAATNADYQNEQQRANQGASNAMFGALGTLGGTALGSLLGPAGASVGGQLGGQLTDGSSGFTASPKLNLGSSNSGVGRYQI